MSLQTPMTPCEEQLENHIIAVDDEPTTDVFLLLRERERDLELAATLGKNLLHKNEGLKLNVEECSLKLEESKQDQHRLKLQMESLKLEKETTINELRSDLFDLEQKLEEERKRSKLKEKIDADTINELQTQNESLLDQMLNASALEDEVRLQIGSLKLQVNESGNSYNDCRKKLEETHEAEMAEMENRIKLKTEECRLLSMDLDQAQDHIQSLEKEKLTYEKKAAYFEAEYNRYQDINMQLLLKLENSMSSDVSGSATVPNETSLFAELEVFSHSMSVDSFDNRPAQKITIGTQLKQEILETYRQLQRLSLEIKGRGEQWSPEAVEINDLKAGQLLFTLTELRTLINDRMRRNLPPMSGQQSLVDVLESQTLTLNEQVRNLKEQLSCREATLNGVTAELSLRDQLYQKKCDEVSQSETLFSSFKNELSKLQREKDHLQDAAVGSLTKDDVIEETRRERDVAIKCKIEAESDLLKLNEELLKLVKQKEQLIRQSEAWQSDMQELIQNKMASEISNDQLKGKNVKTSAVSSSSSPSSFLLSKKRFSLKWS